MNIGSFTFFFVSRLEIKNKGKLGNINTKNIGNNIKLSEKFIIKYHNKLNWELISKKQYLVD